MIVVVSGLPRSGTSLMMQMLTAGGIPALSDGVRVGDADNPRGYFEWEPIKSLPRDPDCIAEAEGKAVKVISTLLMSLPQNYDYRVILMRRPTVEVVASQAAMIQRLQAHGPALSTAAMEQALDAHLKQVSAWIGTRPWLQLLHVHYPAIIADPSNSARSVESWLGAELDTKAMARAVEPSLRRHRT